MLKCFKVPIMCILKLFKFYFVIIIKGLNLLSVESIIYSAEMRSPPCIKKNYINYVKSK